MNGKFDIFTDFTDFAILNSLPGGSGRWKDADPDAQRFACSITLNLCLPCSHPFSLLLSPFLFPYFTCPVSVSVSQGFYSSLVSFQVSVIGS